jgi:hypothetical protein
MRTSGRTATVAMILPFRRHTQAGVPLKYGPHHWTTTQLSPTVMMTANLRSKPAHHHLTTIPHSHQSFVASSLRSPYSYPSLRLLHALGITNGHLRTNPCTSHATIDIVSRCPAWHQYPPHRLHLAFGAPMPAIQMSPRSLNSGPAPVPQIKHSHTDRHKCFRTATVQM